jgi:adenine-specific DNA-methyltransferase
MPERKYKGDTFHNQWQSYKENNNPKEDYEAKRKYVESREYQIRIKVVDVFENDTNKVVRVG